jgi:hypothetical protein
MKPLYFSGNFRNRSYILICACALLLGGIIYILFRTSEPVFFNWINAVGLGKWFSISRNASLPLSPLIPEWIVFSLPSGLWAFAYALLITCIWAQSKSWLRYFWMASIPVLVLGYEILQYAEIIPGTFSIQDIALGMIGLITGIKIGITIIKSDNYEKTSDK